MAIGWRRARRNTNVRRRIGRAGPPPGTTKKGAKRQDFGSRSKASRARSARARDARLAMQAAHGADWWRDKRLKAEYDAVALKGGYSPKAMLSHVTGKDFQSAWQGRDKNEKRAYSKARRAARRDAAWEIAGGYGKGRGSGFVSRNLYRSHAAQYLAKGKKTRYLSRWPTTASGRPRKTPVIFGKKKMNYRVVSVPGSRNYNRSRMGWRAASDEFYDGSWHDPIGPGFNTWQKGHWKGPYKSSGALLAGERSGIGPHATHKKDGKRVRTILTPLSAREGGGEGYAQQEAQAIAEIVAAENRRSPYKRRARARARRNGRGTQLPRYRPQPRLRARRNGLAFVNPTLGGIVDTIRSRTMTSLPWIAYGGVAGAVHAGLAASGMTAKLADFVGSAGNIPVIGPAISPVANAVADNAPFTLQGLVIGIVGGAAVGLLTRGRGGGLADVISAAAPIMVLAPAFGGGLDAFYFVTDRMDRMADAKVEAEIAAEVDDALAQAEAEAGDLEGIAFEGGSLDGIAFEGGALNGLSGIAYEGGALNGLAFEGGSLNGPDLGDGMAYEVTSLAAGTPSMGAQDYHQASLGDASFSGADMSVNEGNAFSHGKAGFVQAFGPAPYRMGREVSGASHLAGREGHRWGWLVKMVGWERACQIAKLPPTQRLSALRQMRQAAIQAFNVMEHQQAASHAAAQTEATAPTGDLFGDPALFMGA